MDSEENWYNTFEELKVWIDKNEKRPSNCSKNPTEKHLSGWIGNQQQNYKKYAGAMKDKGKITYWEEFIEQHKEYFMNSSEMWYKTIEELIIWINRNEIRPTQKSKDAKERHLGKWICTQQSNYKKSLGVMRYKKERLFWEKFVKKHPILFDISLLKINSRLTKRKLKTAPILTTGRAKQRKQSQAEISKLHRIYKTLSSDSYKRRMKKTPRLFKEYHIIAKKLDQSDEPDDRVPNVIAGMIKNMFKNIGGLKKRKVIDLGCGTFCLAQALYDKFLSRGNKTQLAEVVANAMTGVDVVDAREESEIISCDFADSLNCVQNDIADLQDIDDESYDIAVLSRAMWAKNYSDVLDEAWRILKQGGKIIVCEPFMRWWDVKESTNKLVGLFEEKGWDLCHAVGEKLDEDSYHPIFFYAVFGKDEMKM